MKLRITQLREARALSQEQLGEMVGLTAASISRIEAGIQSKTLVRLDRLAAALDVTVRDLFEPEPQDALRAELIQLIEALDPQEAEMAARLLRGLLSTHAAQPASAG